MRGSLRIASTAAGVSHSEWMTTPAPSFAAIGRDAKADSAVKAFLPYAQTLA
jgi:hypothetical protein